MKEEKGKYIVISEYNHFCILDNSFEESAIEIARIMEKLNEDNHSRIFKIEKEINWRKQEEEQKEERKEEKFQINFTQKALVELDALKDQIKAPSKEETICYALRLLQLAVDEIKKGHKIYLASKKGLQEIMPFLNIFLFF